jgi:hypothetical protein
VADRTVTVKSSGGDYTSLNAALAGESGNLVTNTRILTIECYAMTDTTSATTGSGYTTSASYYLHITVPTAERHGGVWNSGKYRLRTTNAYAQTLTIGVSYMRITGMQVLNAATTNGDGAVRLTGTGNASSSSILFDQCLLSTTGTRTGYNRGVWISSGLVTLRNCVVISSADRAVSMSYGTNAPTVVLENCVCIGGTYGVIQGDSTVTARNCYASGATAAYSGTMTLTTCASSDATGSTGLQNVAYSTSTFTSVTAGSEDFSLVSGSALIDTGTDLSATFTVDIAGTTRSGTWDVGAFTYTASGGSTTWIPAVMRHFQIPAFAGA